MRDTVAYVAVGTSGNGHPRARLRPFVGCN